MQGETMFERFQKEIFRHIYMHKRLCMFYIQFITHFLRLTKVYAERF